MNELLSEYSVSMNGERRVQISLSEVNKFVKGIEESLRLFCRLCI